MGLQQREIPAAVMRLHSTLVRFMDYAKEATEFTIACLHSTLVRFMVRPTEEKQNANTFTFHSGKIHGSGWTLKL